MAHQIRFGVQTPPQNCAWQDLVSVWKTIDHAGYEGMLQGSENVFPSSKRRGGCASKRWREATFESADGVVILD